MTERACADLATAPGSLEIGPSLARWEDDRLTIDLDEVAVPVPRRIKGRVQLFPEAVTDRCIALDPGRRHSWWPIAPRARVEVVLDQPALSWSGDGYLDSNEGSEPLEAGFSRWNWSRAHLPGNEAALVYEPVFRDGSARAIALIADRKGRLEEFDPSPRLRLPRTLWGLARETRGDPGRGAKVIETLEDTPFYSRSMLSLGLQDAEVTAMHESLSLHRFDTGLVQLMLPFRMPRRGGRAHRRGG